MLAATRLAFLAAFGVVLGGRTARALDLKGLGFDPAKSLNMAAAMLPVVCNANEQQKTDMECAGCIYSISEFLRALARAEEWAITSEYPRQEILSPLLLMECGTHPGGCFTSSASFLYHSTSSHA